MSFLIIPMCLLSCSVISISSLLSSSISSVIMLSGSSGSGFSIFPFAFTVFPSFISPFSPISTFVSFVISYSYLSVIVSPASILFIATFCPSTAISVPFLFASSIPTNLPFNNVSSISILVISSSPVFVTFITYCTVSPISYSSFSASFSITKFLFVT